VSTKTQTFFEKRVVTTIEAVQGKCDNSNYHCFTTCGAVGDRMIPVRGIWANPRSRSPQAGHHNTRDPGLFQGPFFAAPGGHIKPKDFALHKAKKVAERAPPDRVVATYTPSPWRCKTSGVIDVQFESPPSSPSLIDSCKNLQKLGSHHNRLAPGKLGRIGKWWHSWRSGPSKGTNWLLMIL